MREGARWMAEGLRMRKARRLKPAIRAFERAVQAEPESALAWFWLAVTRDNRGEEAAAIPAYRRAIELGLPREKGAQAWTWLASSLSKTGEPEEALECLKEAERAGGYRPRHEYDRVRASVERRARRGLRSHSAPVENMRMRPPEVDSYTRGVGHVRPVKMMDDITDIRDLYNAGWDTEDSRLGRHQLERDITWLYFDRYLPSCARILEVGAATGRHTLELARRGHTILAVDLAQDLVAHAQERAFDAGFGDRVEFRVGDARSLSGVPERAFDAVLLMGPLYHLVLRDDRLMALRRAFDCLVEGGVIFSSWLSRFGILGDLLKSTPAWIENEREVDSLIESGRRPEDMPKGGFRGYFAAASEIGPLHEEVGFRTMALAGVEPAISADDESYNRLEGRTRQLWLDLLFQVSGEPSLVASSRHLLYIGRKNHA